MYRCQLCDAVSPPYQPLLRHVVYRYVKSTLTGEILRQEIAREIPVCTKCLALLEHGATLRQVVQQRGAPVRAFQPPPPLPIRPTRPSAPPGLRVIPIRGAKT